MPKVSIVLTSYNHEKYLKKAIESALAQSFSDFELIIFDNCSVDGSWDIICGYASKDSRIIPVLHQKNEARIMYEMINRCSGEYVAIHHSDDEWLPDKLEKQVAFLDAHPEVGACFTWVQFIDEGGNEISPSVGVYIDTLFSQCNRSRFEWLRVFFDEGNKLCHPSILIRKKEYFECDMLAVGLGCIPDFVQWIRLTRNRDIHIIGEKLTKFRLRDNQQNDSGDKPSTSIRYSVEDFLTLKEYLALSDEDFCEVFPGAREYQTPDGFMIEYAFAQICLRHARHGRALFAFELLYGLLNDPESAEKLERLYGFGHIDFVRLTDQYDVFGSVPPEKYLQTALDLDFGGGFGHGRSISKTVYLPQAGRVSVSYDLEGHEGIKALRFLPERGRYVRCKITRVMVDGEEQMAQALYAKGMTDGFDVFPTTHPAYLIEASGQKVEISYEIYTLTNWHFCDLLTHPPASISDARKKILYGAGFYGEQALYYYGNDLVHAFADANKAGQEIFGKRIVHPSEISGMDEEHEIVICVKAHGAVSEYLKGIGVHNFKVFDVITEFE